MQAPILIVPSPKARFMSTLTYTATLRARWIVANFWFEAPIPAKSAPAILPSGTPPPAIAGLTRLLGFLRYSGKGMQSDTKDHKASCHRNYAKSSIISTPSVPCIEALLKLPHAYHGSVFLPGMAVIFSLLRIMVWSFHTLGAYVSREPRKPDRWSKKCS